jgi:hypothetical protein
MEATNDYPNYGTPTKLHLATSPNLSIELKVGVHSLSIPNWATFYSSNYDCHLTQLMMGANRRKPSN